MNEEEFWRIEHQKEIWNAGNVIACLQQKKFNIEWLLSSSLSLSPFRHGSKLKCMGFKNPYLSNKHFHWTPKYDGVLFCFSHSGDITWFLNAFDFSIGFCPENHIIFVHFRKHLKRAYNLIFNDSCPYHDTPTSVKETTATTDSTIRSIQSGLQVTNPEKLAEICVQKF